MRVVRWLSAALVAVVVSSVAVAAHAAPTAPTSPYRVFTMDAADAGARQFQGSSLQAVEMTPDNVRIDGMTSPTQFGGQIVVWPRDGETLVPGTMDIAPDSDATHGVVYLHWGLGGCTADSGTFTIDEFSGSGDTAVFTAEYRVVCDGEVHSGVIRWNSAVGFRALSLSPGDNNFGYFHIGSPRDTTLTLGSFGTESPTLGAVSIDSSTPDSFSIVSNTCTGLVMTFQSTCTVVVRTAPVAVGVQHATVRFAHDDDDPLEAGFSFTAIDPVTGTYHPVDPMRLLDTRFGLGTRRAPIGAGQTINFYSVYTGQQKVSAVVLNVTVDHPSTSGYLTLYPAGAARPRASSINFTRAWTGANLVTVPLPADNRISVFNSAGTTAVIADVVGWYAADDPSPIQPSRGGGYHPTQVQRILDTRTAGFGKLPGGYYVEVPVRYANDGRHIAALSVTITAVGMTGPGYLTSWNGFYDAPHTSTLNYTQASGVVSNAAVVPATYCESQGGCSADAHIAIQNQGATPVDVVVDINGFYDDGNLPADVRFHPLASPTRIIDTRSNLGTGRFGTNSTHTVMAPTSVAGSDTIALDANIAAVVPTQRTYLTVWPKFDDYPRPQAAVLNPLRAQTVADHAVAELGYGNLFNVYNFTGATDLVMDVDGTFEAFPPTPAGGPSKRATPRAAVTPTGNLTAARPELHRA